MIVRIFVFRRDKSPIKKSTGGGSLISKSFWG
jgi:hypothetical protein